MLDLIHLVSTAKHVENNEQDEGMSTKLNSRGNELDDWNCNTVRMNASAVNIFAPSEGTVIDYEMSLRNEMLRT